MPGHGIAKGPSRSLLVPGALLSQLVGATCILLGTVAFALTITGGDRALMPVLIGWVVAALSAVVCGGLVYRGNLPSLVIAALLDGVFGVVLFQVSRTLGGLLRMLSPADIELVSTVIFVVALLALVAATACLAAIPQARRYAMWLERADGSDEPGSAASTARGFPPPPVPALRAMPTLRIQVAQGRRRLWFAVVGLAIGVGCGIVVLTTSGSGGRGAATATSAAKVAGDPGQAGSGDPPAVGSAAPTGSGASSGGGSGSGAIAARAHGSRVALTTPQDLLVAQHAAIGNGDIAALAALAAPTAFLFGVDADEVAEGPAAIEAVLRRDLGEVPADGFGIDGKYLQMGEWRDHAWIAEELEVIGTTTRRFTITQLAANLGGRWTVVAWHWAIAVPDAVADKRARDHTLPVLGVVPDRRDGSDELDAAFRAALGTREGLVAGFSPRPDAFNFGSAPGERIPNGQVIRKIFGRLKAELKYVGGALVVAGNVWDKSQASGAWIAYGAANVEFAQGGRPVQPFRVLAVLIKEDEVWQVVQTQFSNGGPIR